MSTSSPSANPNGSQRRFGKTGHWIFLGFLFILLAAIVLMWSTRGVGRPDPNEVRGSTAAIGVRAAINRDASVLSFSLRCMDALRKGNTQDAIKQCSLVLDLDPRNTAALSLRGNAYARERLYAKALDDFSRTIQLAPGNADGYRLRGGIYALQKRNALALADFNSAVALAPSDPFAKEARGHFFQITGRYLQAISDFSALIQRQPMLARGWNSRCWTRVLANVQLDRALADCNRSLELDAKSANAYDSRGYVFYRLNRFSPAIGDFSKAIDLDAKLASAWFGRGLAKLRIKDVTAARDIARAKVLEPAIADRFAGYGIKPHAAVPSGT